MIESVPEKVLHATTVTGGGTAFFGAVTLNEYLAIGGLCIAVASFLVNVYYKHKHYRLACRRLEHKIKDDLYL